MSPKNYASLFSICLIFQLFSCNPSEQKETSKTNDTVEEYHPNMPDSVNDVRREPIENINNDSKNDVKDLPKSELASEKKLIKIKDSASIASQPQPTISPEVLKKEKLEKPSKPAANNCPASVKPLLDFDPKFGLLSCEVNPESTTYHYFLVISKNKSFSSTSIVKSFDLGFNSVFPRNPEQKEQLKKIKEFANLYFKYEVYCEQSKFISAIEGPLSISCRDNGECQLMK